MIEFSNYFTDYRYYYDEYGRKTFYFPSVTTGASSIKNEYENGVKYYDGETPQNDVGFSKFKINE